MEAWLAGGHWLELAAHANAMARKLSAGLAATKGVRIAFPTQANEVFVILPEAADAALKAAGARYYNWTSRSLPPASAPQKGEAFLRLVASFATGDDEVERFIAEVRGAVEDQ